jgi:hypothetical protein
MFLRNLFEARSTEVAIIFGRFNPPHKGHRAAWELASKSPVWYVGTNESTVGPKDPLPYDVKVEAMKTVWPEVEGHIVAETSWLTLASEVYKKYPDATLLCLTDEDWVTKTIVQYNGKEGAHGFYNFKNITQKPTPRLSSATALRDAVTKGDRDAFTQAAGVSADTPVAGKPFFDLVAEYLLPYSNAPKKAAKKKEPAVAEGNSDWSGSQGNFAGDKPVNLGGTVSKRLDVDDVVTYFGEKATILAMSKDRTVSRINLKSGITQNVKTSDLKRVGQGVAEVSKATIDRYVAKASDAHGDADFKARMSKNDPDKRSYHVDQKKTAEKRRQGISRALDRMSKQEDVSERVRDSEDWDEGNTEPPNNFAVYINGKKWKVFKGRGQFADDYKEREHFRQLQNWAQQKSASTGKEWKVRVTGEAPTVSEARMSAQVKLQRAWERQQAKSAASRERGKELLNPTKNAEKKDEKKAD